MLANLQEPVVVKRAVAELSELERSALRAMLEANGVLAWPRFVEQFGDEKADRPWLEFHSQTMQSVPGRLRARGLLYYGTIERQESVVIPRELRPLIAAALHDPRAEARDEPDLPLS